ncbi:MAG: Fic family protein, partial [Gemmatimonadota bacterium]|nr:Fic family protein [Gemmatimonadota bacterium]
VEKDERHRGEYKKFDNHVEARQADGTVEIIFRTASPFDTPQRMVKLVETTQEALEGDGAHPLIVIARFVVEFLAIHPFQDGNGRLSRALTALLMLRSGYEYVPYASVERLIEENKAAYYHALRVSQTAMTRDPADFGEWLLFFLRVLRTQKDVLAGKLEVERAIVQLKEVQVRLLEHVEKQGRVTTAEAGKAFGLSDRTARYHLSLLVERGLLSAQGERRGRYYTRPTASPAEVPAAAHSANAAVLGAILERGGQISATDLHVLLVEHGAHSRLAGSLHGRRKAHLRRNAKTGQSELTSRGREIAEQYLFARRLSQPVRKNPASTTTPT